MSRRSSLEIIDLTASPSDFPSDADSDVVEIDKPRQALAENSKARRKRRRSKKSSLEVGEIAETDTWAFPPGGGRASKVHGGQPGTSSRHRSHSPAGARHSSKTRPRSRSPNAQDDLSAFFYIDVLPQPTTALIEPPSEEIAATSAHPEPKLLLPNHVSIIETESTRTETIEIIRPPSLAHDEKDFIEYLDYNDQIQVSAINLIV